MRNVMLILQRCRSIISFRRVLTLRAWKKRSNASGKCSDAITKNISLTYALVDSWQQTLESMLATNAFHIVIVGAYSSTSNLQPQNLIVLTDVECEILVIVVDDSISDYFIW